MTVLMGLWRDSNRRSSLASGHGSAATYRRFRGRIFGGNEQVIDVVQES